MARTFFPWENLLSPTTMISSVLTTTEYQTGNLSGPLLPTFLSAHIQGDMQIIHTGHHPAPECCCPRKGEMTRSSSLSWKWSGGKYRCCRLVLTRGQPLLVHSACSGLGSEGHLLLKGCCTLPQQQTWDHYLKHVSEFTSVNVFQNIRNVNFI